MRKIPVFLFFIFPLGVVAQSVGIGTSSPNASAQLEIQSSSKGVLIPRMTSAQMKAIASPAKGLLVFNSTDSAFFMRRDSGWVNLSAVAEIGGGLLPATPIQIRQKILSALPISMPCGLK